MIGTGVGSAGGGRGLTAETLTGLCALQDAEELKLSLSLEGSAVAGKAAYAGDGTYLCSYTVKQAGPFVLTLTCPKSKEERACKGACVPGARPGASADC